MRAPSPTAIPTNVHVLRYHGVVGVVGGGICRPELLRTRFAQPLAEGFVPEGSPVQDAGQQENPVVIWVAKFRRLASPKMISKPTVPLTGRLKDSGLLDVIGRENSQYQVPGPP